MMLKPFLTLLIGTSCLCSCDEPGTIGNGEEPETERMGNLDYRADIDPNSRIYPSEGKHLIASVQLYYDAPPEGVYDGDQGADFFIKITDETKLEAGAQFALNDSSFEIYATEWASPAGYDIFDQSLMTGSFTILSYEQFKTLEIDLDLTYGEENYSRTYKREFTFKNNNPWVWAPSPALDWEDFDTTSIFAANEIPEEALQGKWEADNAMMKKEKKASELIYSDNTFVFQVQGNQYRQHTEGDWMPLDLFKNRIGTGDEKAVINSISDTSLVITWIRPYSVMRHSYTSAR